MVNLSLLLYNSAKNNKKINFTNNNFSLENKEKIEEDEDEMFSDDIEELYFESAKWARLTLSKDANNSDANYLLGLLHEQGLSVDINHELAF